MAKSPDPNIKLTSSKGVARTLDDWATIFQLCIVVLPPRPEAAMFVPIVRRITSVLGDADCRIVYCVVGEAEQEALVLCDVDGSLVQSLGLTHLPAFVHLRQDTTLVDAAEGWDAASWQRVADGLAKAMAWSSPTVAGPHDPPGTPGWPV